MRFSAKTFLFSLATATVLSSSEGAPTLAKRSTTGYNDFNCQPSSQHPRSVILVQGTTLTQASWNLFGPKLAAAGYCVFSLTYGKWKDIPVFAGIAPIPDNAVEVGAFADKVLAATGTTQADFVGHSQGGILARYWFEYLDGAGKINRMIGISPFTHGTTLDGITTLASSVGLLGLGNVGLDPFAPALIQMVVNSTFIEKLNAPGDTHPNVFRYDEVVTPYLAGFQTGAGVVNQVLQDLCALGLHEHIFMPRSTVDLQWTLHQLDPSQPNANCLSMI